MSDIPNIGSYTELSDLAIEPTKKTRRQPNRPYAFSDTALIVPQAGPPSPPSPPFDVPYSVFKPRFDCHWWVDKCISLTAHICLISLFETIFFFQYVSLSEDDGLLTAIDNYVGSVAQDCATLGPALTADIRGLVTALVPLANISASASAAAAARASYNHSLQVQSWGYFGGLLGVVICLIGIARCKSYKIQIRRIFAENLALVGLLGVYEYVFFRTIVYNYTTLSHSELTWKIILNLNSTCPVFG
jgi:hypothetical protein